MTWPRAPQNKGVAWAAPRPSRVISALSDALRAPAAASSPSSWGPKISLSKAWPSSACKKCPAERRRPPATETWR
eukprot:9027707-Pyramimonas_sp.AAC.1